MAANGREPALELRTLAQQVAGELAWDILFRRLKPGERLREADLTVRFGVSRPAIREALAHLDKLGLVQNEAWKGARVVRLTRDELDVLFEFRGLVFAFVVELAARRADDAALARLGEVVDELARCAPDVDAEAYERLRTEAHRSLRRATGAQAILRRAAAPERLSSAFVVDTVRTRSDREASAARWRRLLSLLLARDAAGARTYALEMNRATWAAALAAYDALPEDQR